MVGEFKTVVSIFKINPGIHVVSRAEIVTKIHDWCCPKSYACLDSIKYLFECEFPKRLSKRTIIFYIYLSSLMKVTIAIHFPEKNEAISRIETDSSRKQWS